MLGWTGSVLLALCGFPQCWHVVRTGDARGLSWAFLVLWFSGELLLFCYVWPTKDLPLLVNYGLNALLVGIMLGYKCANCTRG